MADGLSAACERRYTPGAMSPAGHLILERVLPGVRGGGDGKRVMGVFRCSCGNEATKPVSRVLSGHRDHKHCGCLADPGSGPRTHGRRGTPEYSTWNAMKDRCLNPSSKDYDRYGGSGVTLHAGWASSFEEFYEHVGPRPEGTTIDRVDNSRGYVPGNVRWATPREQAQNRPSTWRVRGPGGAYSGMEAAGRAVGVTATTIARWCRDPRKPQWRRSR